MTRLDILDERSLYAADLDCDEHEGEPSEDNPLPVVWPTVWQVRKGKWACVLSEAEIVRLVVGCRHALKLPLGDKMRMGLQDTLEQALEAADRSARYRRRTPSENAARWQEFDLLGAVRAATGVEGRRAGANWWFPCPFHADRSPSLEVEPEKRLWHCWGCLKAGGVIDWQRMVTSKGEIPSN